MDCLLEPDPDHRLQSAGALLSALSSIQTGVDRRFLGAMVAGHQSPWQLRVTAQRIDRTARTEQAHAAPSTQLLAPPSAVAIEPEHVLIDARPRHTVDYYHVC